MIHSFFGRLGMRVRGKQAPIRPHDSARRDYSDWEEIATGARRMILYFVALGAAAIVVFASGVAAQTTQCFWPRFAQTAGMGLFLGLGAFAVGCLFGFLFGVPRAPRRDADGHDRTDHSLANRNATSDDNPDQRTPGTQTAYRPSANTYLPNANLEEISDWLTKIIVGLGLIDLKEMPSQLKRLAEFFALTCGCDFCGGLLLTMGAFFLIMGFLLSYVLSRVYLALAFGYSSSLTRYVMALTKETAAKQDRTLSLSSSVKAMALTNEARVAINQNAQNESELDKAIDMLDEALASDPNYVIAYVEKARALKRKALLRQGPEREALIKSAIDVLEKARALRPDHYPAIYNIACYKALLGAPVEEVLRDLKRAIGLNPRLKEVARQDPDLERIRQSEEFKQLTEP